MNFRGCTIFIGPMESLNSADTFWMLNYYQFIFGIMVVTNILGQCVIYMNTLVMFRCTI